MDLSNNTMNQIFRSRHLCRTTVVSVRLILFLVLSVHTSLLALSSFGDAFVLSSSPLLCHRNNILSSWSIISGSSYNGNCKIQKEQEHPRSGGRSLTTSFVFSRLGEDNGVSSRSTSGKTTNTKSNATTVRGYCPKCKRPGVVCICHALPDTSIDCGTRILILQHPREAKKRKRTSTVPLIGLSIQNVAICVGTVFVEGSHPLLDEALAMNDACDDDAANTNNCAVFLYPSEGAVPLQNFLENARNNSGQRAKATADKQSSRYPQTDPMSSNSSILVVVDGTWAQTYSMVQNSHHTLRRLPRVMFDDETNSLFDSLRQEPARHCTSTLEAVSRAIRMMGAPPSGSMSSRSETACGRGADALERSLKAMVDGQLRFALDDENARPRYYRRNETSNEDENEQKKNSKREAGRTRKMVSRKRKAELSLPKAKSKEEIELERIQFVYIAHMG